MFKMVHLCKQNDICHLHPFKNMKKKNELELTYDQQKENVKVVVNIGSVVLFVLSLE